LDLEGYLTKRERFLDLISVPVDLAAKLEGKNSERVAASEIVDVACTPTHTRRHKSEQTFL
jgi:hypothetical protein